MKPILFFMLICLLECNDLVANNYTIQIDSICNKTKDFQFFWSNFRSTVLESDTNKILEFIHSKVLVHGGLDDDTTFFLNRNNFIKIFDIFLKKNTIFIKDKHISTKEYIEITPIAKNSFIYSSTETWVRVGDLAFKQFNHEWRLYLLYFPNWQVYILK
jgi:hypothetical protein